MLRLTMIAIATVVWAGGNAVAAPKAAVFPFELMDTSQHDPEIAMLGASAPIPPDDLRRLANARAEFRALVEQAGRYQVVDTNPLASEIDAAAPFYKCDGCETPLAQKLAADVAITGTIHKISALLLNLTVTVRDAKSGAVTQTMTANIPGNTDEAWIKGVQWLVKNRLLASKGDIH